VPARSRTLVDDPFASAQSVALEMLAGLQWRGIGPPLPGAVSPTWPSPECRSRRDLRRHCTGGVFKSVNEGVSFAPIFDRAGGMMSIGAVAARRPTRRSSGWAPAKPTIAEFLLG